MQIKTKIMYKQQKNNSHLQNTLWPKLKRNNHYYPYNIFND